MCKKFVLFVDANERKQNFTEIWQEIMKIIRQQAETNVVEGYKFLDGETENVIDTRNPILALSTFGSSMKGSYASFYSGHCEAVCTGCSSVRFGVEPNIEDWKQPVTTFMHQGDWSLGFPTFCMGDFTTQEKLCPQGTTNLTLAQGEKILEILRNAEKNKMTTHIPQLALSLKNTKGDIGLTIASEQIINTKLIEDVPSTLMYLDACLSGWEPSLAIAFIGRGTKYVIGFRKFVETGLGDSLAKQFWEDWASKDFEVDSILTIFLDLAPGFIESLAPKIFIESGEAKRIKLKGVDPELVQVVQVKKARGFLAKLLRKK